MAYPPIPYRASEPSQMETQLAVLATDPARAGAAMQLLPGAAAIRQDIGARANIEADRDAALAAITQSETARHQQSDDATKVLALSQPGAARIGMALPINQSLFANAPAGVTDIANANMSGQFAQQAADVQDKNADAYLKGVQSGYQTPLGVASQQQGYGINLQQPLALREEAMRQAGANARAATEANKMQYIQFGSTIGPDGTPQPTLLHVPPGMEDEAFAQLMRRRADLARLGTNATGETGVVGPTHTEPLIGTPVGKKTGVVQPPVVVRPGSSTSAAGGALAPNTKSATQSAPQSGGPFVVASPPPRNGNNLLDDYIRGRPLGEQQALVAAKSNGTLRYGKDSTGNLYITLNNKPIVGPLQPK